MPLVLGPPPLPKSRRTPPLVLPGLALMLAGYAVAITVIASRPVRPARAAPTAIPSTVELDWGGPLGQEDWSFDELPEELPPAGSTPALAEQQRGRWWLRRASRLYHHGRLPAALAAYQHARALLPGVPLPCLRGARLALVLERLGEAIDLAECARDRAPGEPLPYLYIGAAHQLAGHSDQAAQAYFQFAARAPGHPRTGEAEKVGARLLVELQNEGGALHERFGE